MGGPRRGPEGTSAGAAEEVPRGAPRAASARSALQAVTVFDIQRTQLCTQDGREKSSDGTVC